MDTSTRSRLPERNPKTHAEHRREVLWQITMPLLLGVLVLLAAVGGIIFSSIQPVTDLERWADVSLMWMILPSLFFVFILLIALIGLVYLISLLIRLIPRYTYLIQYYIELIGQKVSQINNLLVEPILRMNSTWAAARRALSLGRKKVQE